MPVTATIFETLNTEPRNQRFILNGLSCTWIDDTGTFSILAHGLSIVCLQNQTINFGI